MQIDRILYPVTSLGPGNRVAIWTIGCPRRCRNCSNPELWTSDSKRDICIEDLISFIDGLEGSIDGITITGGEPFAQETELKQLLKRLREHEYSDILVYSGFTFDYLNNHYTDILPLVDVVIAGEYIDELNDNKGIRGSSNQTINVINEGLRNKYSEGHTCERRSENFFHKGKVISAGIPIKAINAIVDSGTNDVE